MGCCQTDTKKTEDLIQIALSPKNQTSHHDSDKYTQSDETLPSNRVNENQFDMNDITSLTKVEAYESKMISEKDQKQKKIDLPMPVIRELFQEQDLEKSSSGLSKNQTLKHEKDNKRHFQPFNLIVDVDIIENFTPKFNDEYLQSRKQQDPSNLNSSEGNESSFNQTWSPGKRQQFELKHLSLNKQNCNRISSHKDDQQLECHQNEITSNIQPHEGRYGTNKSFINKQQQDNDQYSNLNTHLGQITSNQQFQLDFRNISLQIVSEEDFSQRSESHELLSEKEKDTENLQRELKKIYKESLMEHRASFKEYEKQRNAEIKPLQQSSPKFIQQDEIQEQEQQSKHYQEINHTLGQKKTFDFNDTLNSQQSEDNSEISKQQNSYSMNNPFLFVDDNFSELNNNIKQPALY